MRAIIPTLALSSVLLAGCAGADEGSTPGSAKPYIELDDQSSQLREDFNRSKGSVRLLFVRKRAN